MGRTSNTAKQDWNAKRYTQVKVSVRPEIAAMFKAACESAGVSMASAITQFMADYSVGAAKRGSAPDCSTRRKRRLFAQTIKQQMECARDAEEESRDRIPENLRGSENYERADEIVSLWDEVIELMGAIY